MMLEHESEWSTRSGLWYMPILKWYDDKEQVLGKLVGFTGLKIHGTVYEQPFVLSYN